MHIACHARAQNIGQKAADMLRLVPEADVTVIERCSGHGGSWGCKKDNFETALKVGKPGGASGVRTTGKAFVSSECPLAGIHISQGHGASWQGDAAGPELLGHPIEILARAYGVIG